jgi:hypothetical protein
MDLPGVSVPESADVGEKFGLVDMESSRSAGTSAYIRGLRGSESVQTNPTLEAGESSEDQSASLTPESTSRRMKKSSRELSVRIFKGPRERGKKGAPEIQTPAFATITQSEIQEKVDAAIKSTIGGFLERSKAEVLKDVDQKLKIIEMIITRIDTKIDREFVERMFNKFRVVIGDLKKKIDDIQATFMGWVTREELEEVMNKFVDRLVEIKDTAVGSSKYKCLLCGKPRTHVAGMLIGSERDEGEEDPFDISEEVEDKKVITKNSRPRTAGPRRTGQAAPRDVVQLLKRDAMHRS